MYFPYSYGLFVFAKYINTKLKARPQYTSEPWQHHSGDAHLKLSIVLSLCGSLALGGAALLVARVWLPSGTPEAEASTAAAPANLSQVVVASSDLAYGTTLDAGKLTLASMPPESIPAGAFTSIDAILNQDGGAPLVLTAMAAHEVVLPAKISGPGSRPSVAIQIADGMRGYAINVTDASGVGGNALPGDWVDVILTRETNPERPDRGLVSEVVLQNVRVLGLDLNADPTSTETAVRRTATLQVDLEDVQKLALASQLGDLSLALRRTGETAADKVATLHAAQVSTAAGPIGAAPVRRAAPRAGAPASPAPSQRTITIVNGGEASRITVPADRAVSGAEG